MKKFAKWIMGLLTGEEDTRKDTGVIREADDTVTVYDDPRVYEASVLVLC